MNDNFELRPPQIVTPEGVAVDNTVSAKITPHYKAPGVTLFHGDCLDVLRELPDESVHAVVTDPPYGLSNTDPGHVTEAITHWTTGDRAFLPSAGSGFMGKAWDEFVPPPAVWDECMRVLKPGGHLLAFAGSRTVDLMALSIRARRVRHPRLDRLALRLRVPEVDGRRACHRHSPAVRRQLAAAAAAT
jgi:hypothetical protein